jgi:hypothetical protein
MVLWFLEKRFSHERAQWPKRDNVTVNRDPPSIVRVALGIPRGKQEKAETVLEFVDDRDNMLWRFPNVTPLRNLLATVHYQVAPVSDFLNDIPNEE